MNSIKLTLPSFILGLSLMAFSQTQAQKPATAQVRGVIVDAKSGRIPKATILIEGAKHKWNLESDEDGEFKLELPAGKYQFTVEKPHFKRLIVLDFCVMGGSKVSYEFQMEIGECSDCDWIIRDKPNPPNAPPNKSFEMTPR